MTHKPELHALYLLATGGFLWWHPDFPKRGPGGRITKLADVAASMDMSRGRIARLADFTVDIGVSTALVRLFCRQGWVEEIEPEGPYHRAVLTPAGAARLRRRARGLQLYGHREHQAEYVTYAAFLFAAVERWEDRGKILTFPRPVEVYNQAAQGPV